MTVVAIVVVGGVNVGAVEVGVVGVRRTVDRARPVVAVATAIVQRAAVDVASADKEQFSRTFRVARYLYPGIKIFGLLVLSLCLYRFSR